jgi:hypothetical protein
MKIRSPAVAGQFYPAYPAKLKKDIEEYLNNVELKKDYKDVFAIISPHAGYIFSGQTAAHGYKAIYGKHYDTVVVLAPSHHIVECAVAVCDCDYYQTPLGNIPVEKKIVNELVKYTPVDYSETTHKMEHSLEVQLPFLQSVLSDFSLVPIIIAYQSLSTAQRLSEILYDLFEHTDKDVLFVLSSDLSHYHDAKTAEKLDKRLIDAVKKRDVRVLDELIQTGAAEACGFACIETGMLLAKKFNRQNVDILNYAHSGMVIGDYSQVVGYLSAVFY